MPEHDDELRDVFREGRAADQQSAPSFGATWGAAAGRRGQKKRWVAGALALAAAALLLVWLLPSDATPPTSDPEIAETMPQDVPAVPEQFDERAPDVPLDGAFAEWEPDSYDAPTDFLLESDGVLAGGMPTSDWDEPMIDFEDTLDTTEL